MFLVSPCCGYDFRGWLADKVGERVNIAVSFLLLAIAIGLMAIIPPVSPAWLYGLGWVIAGIGVGLATRAYQSLINKSCTTTIRGVAFGLFSTSLAISITSTSVIGGYLWENVSPQFPFMVTAVVSLLSIIPVWFKFWVSGDINTENPGTNSSE